MTATGDSAAARGVHKGDELLPADGRRADSLLTEASGYISGATPQWIRSRALSTLLAGDFGTETPLRLRGPDGKTRELRAVRAPAVTVTPGTR